MTDAGRWLNAAIAALGVIVCAPLTAFFAYKWLATDEANTAYACGSGSRGGTCTSGEITNMALTFVFAGITLLGIVLVVMVFRSRAKSSTRSA